MYLKLRIAIATEEWNFLQGKPPDLKWFPLQSQPLMVSKEKRKTLKYIEHYLVLWLSAKKKYNHCDDVFHGYQPKRTKAEVGLEKSMKIFFVHFYLRLLNSSVLSRKSLRSWPRTVLILWPLVFYFLSLHSIFQWESLFWGMKLTIATV